MLQRITSQATQIQSPSPTLLPSQPLPNPKGGINIFHSKEAEGEKDEDGNEEGSVSWWYNLLAQLVDFDDEEDEESEDESEEEDEDESAEEDSEDESADEEDQTEEEKSEDKEEVYNTRTSFIATLFNNKDIKEEAKFGAVVAKESARNEKIAKKSLKAKSRTYVYAPKEPMRTHCHALGVTS
ncbi:hypothetical protein PIB30_046862 [Stylosanthes scabra]|uniref:Uncharacterized protein n=1 Tax=Stylosanthes scabra TaxID=79078 RepID=A0ABU6YGQ8_9FABA|nr:hypothetical protein [Stylosanthes scabra]